MNWNPRSIFGQGNQVIGIFVVLLVIILISSLLSPYFLTTHNMIVMSRSLAFVGLVAIAQALVLMMGDIDASIGSIAGFCSIVAAKVLVDAGLDIWSAMIVGVACGAILGVINGIIITTFRINSLVVTIGTLSVYAGLSLYVTKGQTVNGLPDLAAYIGGGRLLGIPVPLYALAIVFIVMAFVMRSTVFGRRVYAVGSSPGAADVVGIKRGRIRTYAFGIAGAIAGLAGILMAFRLTAAQSDIGESWLLVSIAAPVIGGVSPTGGTGSLTGAVIGAAILVVVGNIIVLAGVNSYLQQVVNGGIVVVAVVLDAIIRRRRR